MGILVRDGGVWKDSEPHVRDGGVWKPADTGYVKDAGVWKEFYSSGPPAIGEPWEGGFYLGEFNGYHLVVADKSAEVSLMWKTDHTFTAGTGSLSDGWSNTNAMNNSTHPAAKHCRDYRGGGFDDWYLASIDELNVFWLNIAPGNSSTPAAFKTGGPQELTVPAYHWSSTQHASNVAYAWKKRFSNGHQSGGFYKSSLSPCRPIRRLKI